MANTAVSGTLFCSDGSEIPLFVAAVAEGTETNLLTSTTNNFTVSASAVGTAFAGKQVVASSPIMGDGDGNTTASYAYILRAGTILSILPVGLAGIVDMSRMPIPKPVVLQAGDQVRVMMNASTDRECALSVYTNRGECHIFAVTPSGAATNELVSILTGNGIGETLQGQNLTTAFATSIDRVKLAPSGMGVYVVDDKNNIVGSVVATAPSTQQVRFNSCNIPIGLNFQLKQSLQVEVIYLSLYNKLPSTQLKNLTSSDLMKLGQLSFVDAGSVGELRQLEAIKNHTVTLVSNGGAVFADSLKLSAQTVNGGSTNFKPSDIYDGESFADTYLIEVLAIGATVASSTAIIALQLTDGSSTLMLQKPTNVTASGPMTFLPTTPLYLNESNYLSVTNSESVNCSVVLYCAIVARGGAPMNEDYRIGFADGYREARRDLQQFGVMADKDIAIKDFALTASKSRKKPRRSSKAKLLDKMTKPIWDKYKKGRGKKTYVQIRAQVSRSQKYKRAVKRL